MGDSAVSSSARQSCQKKKTKKKNKKRTNSDVGETKHSKRTSTKYQVSFLRTNLPPLPMTLSSPPPLGGF